MNKHQLHKECIVCKGKKLRSMKDYQTAHLCQCKDCGFVFSKQIPTENELVEHYNRYSRNDYLSPLTIKRYNELLDQFEKYRRNNKLLDVGCGVGYFLDEAQKRGWEVYGTEFTDDAFKICKEKNINMSKGVLDPKNYELEAFDVITSFEVIEHINNPIDEISKMKMILRDEGIIYVTTPNFNSLLRYKLKSNYNVITFPEHLSYYTPKTLARLFITNSFKKVKIQTTGISITRLRTSKGISNQEIISASSDDEFIRNTLESRYIFRLVKSIINHLLTFFGIGDNIKGIFIKK